MFFCGTHTAAKKRAQRHIGSLLRTADAEAAANIQTTSDAPNVYLLGTLHTQTDVAVEVAHNNKGLRYNSNH